MSTHVRHSQFRAAQRVISTQWRAGLSQHRSLATENPAQSPRTFRLAVKDNIATKNLTTTCASKILEGYESPMEATIVTQLRRRGATVVSKTGMDEFAMGSHSITSAFEPVHNVGRLQDFSAGGSSGGSAVAVRKGEADLALGTDTGGSVRLPAAYTEVVGFKPSYGMLSRWGVVPYANSLDTVGLLATTVGAISDMIIEEGLWQEHDPNDPTSLPTEVRKRCAAERNGYGDAWDRPQAGELRGFTFGIPLEYNIEELQVRIRKAWLRAIGKIESAGGRVVPISLPTTKTALSAYYVIAPAEASSNLAKYDGIRYGIRDSDYSGDALEGVLYAKTRGSRFGSEVKRRIVLGSYSLSSKAMDNYFIQAQKVRQLVRRDFNRVFKLSNPLQDQQSFDLSDMDETVPLKDKLGPPQVDFILCPTAPTTPPRLDDIIMKQQPLDSYVNDVFTVPASLAGLPAISIPMDIPEWGRIEGSILVEFGGLQLIGQYWDDARLLYVAETLSHHVSSQMRSVSGSLEEENYHWQ
ncbi:amidase signature enzyme [Xylariaceae sp. FL0662B]|nr:amidase signature enzyme [Xylariaceae sp. FL0662B]